MFYKKISTIFFTALQRDFKKNIFFFHGESTTVFFKYLELMNNKIKIHE